MTHRGQRSGKPGGGDDMRALPTDTVQGLPFRDPAT